MKELTSFASMAAELLKIEAAIASAAKAGLKEVTQAIEKTANEEFGVYQQAAGQFKAWEQLKPETQYTRERKGFTPNDPLLRTGKLKKSVEHKIDGLEAAVGSNDQIMVYQEIGTRHIPPRSIFGIAAVKNKDKIEHICGKAIYTFFGNTSNI